MWFMDNGLTRQTIMVALMSLWQLQEAKSRFSELVKQAVNEGTQDITVRGEPVAVILSRADYLRLTRPKPGFLEFMQQSPFEDEDLHFDRDRSLTREVDL